MLEKYRGNDFPVISDIIEDVFGRGMTQFRNEETSVPKVNIKETDNKYQVELAVPGVNKEDLHIDLEDNLLSISAEKQDEKEEKEEDGKFSRREFSYTSFKRVFTLPENANADKINAEYKDGILCLDIPKKEEKKNKTSKNIKIK
jgi:HSP20 family protein